MRPGINRLFYAIKPLIPRPVQIRLRRLIARYKRHKGFFWPIDPKSANPPKGWPGWPEGKQFALVLSHDVDTRKGYEKVLELVSLEERLGVRSQFNFVPERYGEVKIDLLNELKNRGFAIGVHGLKHDGKLFSSKEIFNSSAPRINAYLKKWGTRGFTTPSMLRNHEWMLDLDIDCCVSTFDTDPFEPQPEGVGTIFPFWVRSKTSNREFLELPYTLVQDFTLFVILGEKTISLWKDKVDWIARNGGMALLNTHPDYMNFGGKKLLDEEYPVRFYIEFLEYIKLTYGGKYFHAVPPKLTAYFNKICIGGKHSNSSSEQQSGVVDCPSSMV